MNMTKPNFIIIKDDEYHYVKRLDLILKKMKSSFYSKDKKKNNSKALDDLANLNETYKEYLDEYYGKLNTSKRILAAKQKDANQKEKI